MNQQTFEKHLELLLDIDNIIYDTPYATLTVSTQASSSVLSKIKYTESNLSQLNQLREEENERSQTANYYTNDDEQDDVIAISSQTSSKSSAYSVSKLRIIAPKLGAPKTKNDQQTARKTKNLSNYSSYTEYTANNLPLSVLTRPATMEKQVVFPAPLGPSNPTASPLFT